MAGPEVDGEPREIERMHRGLRAFVARGWGQMSARAFLSSLCAATFAPVLAAGAGVTGAEAVAGVTVLSSIGSGVLSSVLVSAFDRLRVRGHGAGRSGQDREQEFARQIEQVLAAENRDSRALMREIDEVLRKVGAWEVLLEAGIASGEQGVHAVLSAVTGLAEEMAGAQLLIDDVQQSAAEILRNQQAQLAEDRARHDQLASVLASISRTMDALAVESNRAEVTGESGAERRKRWVSGCPYRGLAPYREADEGVFYGREQPTSELATFLGQQLNRGQLVAVTGPSGVGKSSLLQAGLVPALRLGVQLPGSQQWPAPIVMTPTDDPLTELATRLGVRSGLAVAMIRDQLAGNPDQAHVIIRQALLASDGRLRPPGPRPDDPDAAGIMLASFRPRAGLPNRPFMMDDPV